MGQLIFELSFEVTSPIHTWLLNSRALSISQVSVMGVILGAIYLINRKLIPWQIPLTFILTVWVLTMFVDGNSWHGVLSSSVLFGGFFLLPDTAGCPITTAGRILFSIIAGTLVVIFNRSFSSVEALTYGILLVNSVTPLLDRYLQPRHALL